ncbi:MAG: hypothetical protein HOP15_03390 [Planctomycetes bacterium]|nr:hypothetical protein [Planctomycetota bacterium]
MSKLAASIAPLFLVASALPGRTQAPFGDLSNLCPPFAPENSIEWPEDEAAFGAAQEFGRVVLAELDGDEARDAIVLAGGVAIVLWKAAVYDAPQVIEFPSAAPPTGVTDAATLAGAGPGGADAVLMSDERGLFLVAYDNGAFDEPSVILGGPWAGVAKLHAEDMNEDEMPDLVLGIAADQRSILRCHWDGATFVDGGAIPLSLLALDVVAVNWDGVGPRELVVLTRRGLLVFGETGLLQVVSHVSARSCAVRFRAPDIGEGLAWTRLSGAGGSELLVVNQNLMEGPWPLTFELCDALTAVEPSALLAGGYDSDGDEELLIVHEANQTAIVLTNLGSPGQQTPAHFKPGNPAYFQVVPLAHQPLAPGNVGIPAFDELDGEAPEDLVFPVASTARVEVFLGQPYLPSGLLYGHANSADVTRRETEYGPGDHHLDGSLRFAFRIPANYYSHTHIDMIVWHQEHAGTTTSPYAAYHARHLLDSSGAIDDSVNHQWISIAGPTNPEPWFPEDQCWGEVGKPYYFTEFRFAKIVAGQAPVYSRIFAGGFTLVDCDDATSYVHLTSRGIPNSLFQLYEHNGLTTGPESRQLLGAYVPMHGVPYFGENANPDAGPREEAGIPPATHYAPGY